MTRTRADIILSFLGLGIGFVDTIAVAATLGNSVSGVAPLLILGLGLQAVAISLAFILSDKRLS